MVLGVIVNNKIEQLKSPYQLSVPNLGKFESHQGKFNQVRKISPPGVQKQLLYPYSQYSRYNGAAFGNRREDRRLL